MPLSVWFLNISERYNVAMPVLFAVAIVAIVGSLSMLYNITVHTHIQFIFLVFDGHLGF